MRGEGLVDFALEGEKETHEKVAERLVGEP